MAATGYFTVQGATPREAMTTMKRLYGPDARIHSHRTVKIGGVLGLFTRDGVEITGFVEPVQAGSAITGDASVADGAAAANADHPVAPFPPAADGAQRFAHQKRRILEQSPSGTSLQRLVDEVAALRARLDQSLPETAEVSVRLGEHPRLLELDALLARNDFAPGYRVRLLDQVRGQFSLQQLEDQAVVHHYLALQIGRKLAVATPLAATDDDAADGPLVCVVVGPTGVGKTTTIAKLAAIHGIGATNPDRHAAGTGGGNGGSNGSGRGGGQKVQIVTIDNYRIGARQQIETYGEIMRIPVTAAETGEDLKKALALGRDADLIFIDTVGRSPGDYARLGEMRAVLEAAGRRSTTQLAVSATTKYPDLEEILRQFEPFGYDSVIVTKLDETTTIGNVLSVLAARHKPVSYLCDGQVVPQDIAPAAIGRLLISLDGFQLERTALEHEFGVFGEGSALARAARELA